MSDDFDEVGELWDLFDQDVTRALDEAEAALLQIQSDGVDEERINQLYRGLHSIKGNARAMGLAATERLTHGAEDLIALCRDKDLALDGEILDTILETVDRLRDCLPEVAARREDGFVDDHPDLVNVRDKLTELVGIHDVDGSRQAATLEDFILFDDLEDDDEGADEPEVTAEHSAETPESDAKEPTSVEPAKPEAERRASKPDDGSTETIYIQISATKIQEILALASDLGLAADVVMSDEGVVQARTASERLAEKVHRLRRLTRDLRFASAGLALVPVTNLFARLRRIGRELARDTGKDFDIVLKGESCEIDRFLVDQVYDPLMHVVRNAVDHGLEDSETRIKNGKNPRGRVEVRASNAGQGLLLEVRDDGAGLHREAILAKARSRGLIGADSEPDDDAVWRLILEPGFSTRESVSKLSGRGVGMDVVNQTIRRLRGSLRIHSIPGAGTTFSLQLPITLAFADVLLVEVGERSYAIPLESIQRIATPSTGSRVVSSASREEYLRLGERVIPIFRLDDRRATDEEAIVVLKTSRGNIAMPVSQVVGTEQVTLRPLNPLLSRIRGAAACGLLSNGEVAVTLDSEQLASLAETQRVH